MQDRLTVSLLIKLCFFNHFKFQDLAIGNVLSNAINIGNRLNFFKVIAEISNAECPVLPEKIAEKAGCKER